MYCFVGTPEFSDWRDIIMNHPFIGYIKDPSEPHSFIIPLRQEQHQYPTSVIPANTEEQYHTFANKAKFACYMMKHFPDNIPVTYYYRDSNNSYSNWPDHLDAQCIIKPIRGHGAIGVQVVNVKEAKDETGQHRHRRRGHGHGHGLGHVVISEFVPHHSYWVGHFLTIRGTIIYRIYFTSESKGNIKRGKIVNYQIHRGPDLPFNEEIFYQMFKSTRYSGITCSDFTVRNGKPLLFEVNPRPGGSLMHDKPILNELLQALLDWHKTLVD